MKITCAPFGSLPAHWTVSANGFTLEITSVLSLVCARVYESEWLFFRLKPFTQMGSRSGGSGSELQERPGGKHPRVPEGSHYKPCSFEFLFVRQGAFLEISSSLQTRLSTFNMCVSSSRRFPSHIPSWRIYQSIPSSFPKHYSHMVMQTRKWLSLH